MPVSKGSYDFVDDGFEDLANRFDIGKKLIEISWDQLDCLASWFIKVMTFEENILGSYYWEF